MSHDRRAVVSRSTNRNSLRCHLMLLIQSHAFGYEGKNRFRYDRRNTVPDHSEAVPDGRMELEGVVKSLQTRPLPNCNNSRFFGVYRAHRLVRALIFASPCAQVWALAIPRKSGMSS